MATHPSSIFKTGDKVLLSPNSITYKVADKQIRDKEHIILFCIFNFLRQKYIYSIAPSDDFNATYGALEEHLCKV